MIRIGQGHDTHAFDRQRRLILGGVEVPCERGGLRGHSDADVLTHAVASALLGSLALGDLGKHFSDQDAQWKDAHSLDLLRQIVGLVQARGFRVVNCDSTIVAQEPRLSGYIDAMRQNIAECLQVAMEQVSIKATTAEGLGALGRVEGISAEAVVLVSSD